MRRNKRGKTQKEPTPLWDDPASIGLSLIDSSATYGEVLEVVEEMAMFSSDIETYDVISTPKGLVAVCQPRYGQLSDIRRAELRERIREDLYTTLHDKLRVHAPS